MAERATAECARPSAGICAATSCSAGRALGSAVDRYNTLVGSLETRVLPQARRFEEFAADHEGKAMPELKAIEASIRPVTTLAVEAEEEGEPGRLAALTSKGR